MNDVAIIGAGVSGLTAAIYAARNGYSTQIFEGGSIGGQIILAKEVENYPGYLRIDGYTLAENMHNQAKALGVQFVGEQVTQIDLTKKIINGKYTSKYIVLAMGQSPKTLNLARENAFIGQGVSYCAVCDGMFYKNKQVVVIGGGNTAIQDCIHLSHMCSKVFLVHRRDEFRADVAEIKKLENIKNIEIIKPDTITEIVGEDRIEGVNLASGKQLLVSGIFYAIGYIPNTDIIKNQLKLSRNGYIVTDEKMRTEISGVMACGDIVEKPLRQLVTACNDGAVAISCIE